MTRARASVALSILILGLALLAQRTAGLRAIYFGDTSFGTPSAQGTSDVTTEALMADAPVRLETPFSVQWSGYVNIARAGRYVFSSTSNGMAALIVDGRKVAGDLNVGASIGLGNPGDIQLESGPHSLVVRYVHAEGLPAIALRMAKDDDPAHVVALLDLSPLRRRPILYTCASLISVAAAVTLALWIVAIGVWLGRRLPASMFAGVAAATALFIAGVVYDTPSWLRGPAPYPTEWQWAYHAPLTAARWQPVALAVSMLLGILAFLSSARSSRSIRLRAIGGLAAATIAGSLFQIALLHFEPDGAVAAFTQRTLSDDITSYFSVAANEHASVSQFLSSYAAEMPRRDRHATSHPPGPILYYRAVIAAVQRFPGASSRLLRAMERVGVTRVRLDEGRGLSDVLLSAAFLGGLGIAFCAVLAAWPVASVARSAGADRITAAQVGTLWMFCPGPSLFCPQFDQVVTLLVASTCALGCIAMQSSRRRTQIGAALASGATAGAAVFCSFGAVPMLATAGVMAIVLTPAADRYGARLAQTASLALVSFGIISAVPVLAGYDLLTTAREALSISRYSYEIGRSYGLWLWFNLLDFGIFLGVPLLFYLIGRIGRRSSEILFRLDLLAAVAALILLLDVSGVVRGEIGRLWMPFMPLAFIAAVPLRPSAESSGAGRGFAERLFIGVLLAAVSVVLRLYWDPA